MPELVHVKQAYSTEDVEAGLIELASWHGSSRQASRTLADRGIHIPATTLQDWKRTHAERYQEIQETIVPQIREHLAAQQEQIARRAAEVTMQALGRASDELDEIPARDLAGAIRNLGTTAAIGIDKASLLRGLPTEIHQRESVDGILKELQAKYPGLVVDSTAEEIPTEEVPQAALPEGRGAGATSSASVPKRPRAKPAKQGN